MLTIFKKLIKKEKKNTSCCKIQIEEVKENQENNACCQKEKH
ncbi:hypothetical protein [Alkalihalobacterium alkalinitrilicum]|nr:hypothetical protein [Alkalihalobacterium alkalinitrilicum]